MTTFVFWMSFVDPDRPPGQRNLGVCIVELTIEDYAEAIRELDASDHADTYDRDKGPWVWAAAKKARAMGCNPGGEVLSFDITYHPDQAWVRKLPRNKLLTPVEATILSNSPTTH